MTHNPSYVFYTETSVRVNSHTDLEIIETELQALGATNVEVLANVVLADLTRSCYLRVYEDSSQWNISERLLVHKLPLGSKEEPSPYSLPPATINTTFTSTPLHTAKVHYVPTISSVKLSDIHYVPTDDGEELRYNKQSILDLGYVPYVLVLTTNSKGDKPYTTVSPSVLVQAAVEVCASNTRVHVLILPAEDANCL